MPLMDGYELINRIRESERQTGAHLPVIAVTANAMADDIKKCLDSGMDDYISKSAHLDDLQLKLEAWLK
ncbi:hypothetical protein BOW37_10080 [Solemya velum gill symbiont]|nr:hypothetical protein BOV91_01610 [Solemya velum gill symbiont]OOY47162.1 hypothetical protein BOV93_07555 [Solemya velum gill symbiont]OOY59423.1 hypothetical protein BOW02_09585 [Solemya velum gill symbiont]OOY61744.1 hypothetical protein BOW04_08755 [Solemya velum gill symbiont]OOY64296.1 hypothetical protein BOW05_09825 [Solemya velum gill symbiont]